MNSKKKVRVAVDVLLTVMLVFEMFIQYTGNFLHEVVGFAFFATVIGHLALSAAWMKKTAVAARKGSMAGRRTALAVMGVLLAIALAVLGVSSIAISGLLQGAGFVWAFGPYAVWATVHAVSSYAFCALVVVHLAMHWAFLASAFKVEYNPSRRRAISAGVNAVAAVGAVALGVVAVREAMPRTVTEAAAEALESEGAVNGQSSPSAGAGASSDVGDGAYKDAPVNDLQKESESADGSMQGGKHKHRRGASNEESNSPEAGASSGGNATTDESSRYDGGSQQGEDAAVNDAWQDVETEDSRTYEGYSDSKAESVDPELEPDSSIAGICTLCRKQCPLSAPRCSRPYEEGLL